MPKLLITEACLVDLRDDRGGQHQSVGDMPDVPKDIAADLVAANRALYIKREDDFDKGGRNTASREMLRAAEGMAKAAARETDKPA
ncbi:MAG: hypothetical protein KKF85_03425 [Gammaproteobacteria bacterium]|nr:hypothetical protein [Rhodocyclaceae bacterium]MBU3908874.1 hypothetical protein [Gammaproteobacteria bacterium]MBU3987741.1 hypothetical protein [Gammaproteobacteria bacterium]MBU4003352.1 hypothetical protein [Gammaproteobacteria bacterium]MBU4021823.1 hypothetical protein [Gammaproteobacteria bacterium]